MKRYPQRPQKPKEVRIRYLPDSPEQIAQSIDSIGYRAKLESTVKAAIERVNRRR